MQPKNFQLLAKYNQWINKKLLACAGELSEEELKQDMGAFFGSMLGTLNHLLVADIIWLQRFANHPARFNSLELLKQMESPETLDQQLHSDLDDLKSIRSELDAAIVNFCEELTDTALVTSFEYRNMKGENFQNKLAYPLQHFFNHQTHHRGQLTTLLNQKGIDVGVTDLLITIRDLQPD